MQFGRGEAKKKSQKNVLIIVFLPAKFCFDFGYACVLRNFSHQYLNEVANYRTARCVGLAKRAEIDEGDSPTQLKQLKCRRHSRVCLDFLLLFCQEKRRALPRPGGIKVF